MPLQLCSHSGDCDQAEHSDEISKWSSNLQNRLRKLWFIDTGYVRRCDAWLKALFSALYKIFNSRPSNLLWKKITLMQWMWSDWTPSQSSSKRLNRMIVPSFAADTLCFRQRFHTSRMFRYLNRVNSIKIFIKLKALRLVFSKLCCWSHSFVINKVLDTYCIGIMVMRT